MLRMLRQEVGSPCTTRELVKRDGELVVLPDGSLPTSIVACLPSRLTVVGLDRPERYAAFLITPIPNFCEFPYSARPRMVTRAEVRGGTASARR